MENPSTEENIFWVHTGTWVVARKDHVDDEKRESPPLIDERSAIEIGFDDKQATLLFTDEDLAERFITQTGRPEFAPVPVGSREQLSAFLLKLKQCGRTYVAIDPSQTKSLVLSIDRVLKGIANEGKDED